MSRLYVLPVNVIVVAIMMTMMMMMIGVVFSEDANREPVQIKRSIRMIRGGNVLLPQQNHSAVSFVDSSLPFLHFLKHKTKIQYQKLDRIPTTTATPETPRTCFCVPFYQCDSNQTIITDGSGLIDFRVDVPRCPGIFDVCCYLRNVTGTPSTFPPTIPTVPSIPTVLPNCICVERSQCDPNGIVTIFGEGVITPRQQYGLCPIASQVCCRIFVTSPPMTTVPSVMTSSPPVQTQQLCFVCNNTIQCFTCPLIIGPNGSVTDPRFSQILSAGNVCALTTLLFCQPSPPVSSITDLLGPLKNPGTPQACYCVKTWLCSQGNVVNPDGLGIIDPRFTACSSADQVCCRLAGIDLQGLRGLSVFPSGLISRRVRSDSLLAEIACGIQNNSYAPPQPFLADSGKTYFAEFPWMVALFVKPATNDSYVFQCGASMISNEAILTAAHCVVNQKAEKLIARFGQWDMGSNVQPLPIQEANILEIAVHPSYYSGGLFHDVAILVLKKPVVYNANVMPICLPEQSMIFSVGSKCQGIGWGSNSFGSEGKYQAELRKVDLPIVDRTDCQTRLRSTKLGPYFQLHGSFICAGGEENRDTCRGDGGGPLICQATTGQFFQAGITSWGIGCGASVPAVYASVSQHRQWIDQQLATFGVYSDT